MGVQVEVEVEVEGRIRVGSKVLICIVGENQTIKLKSGNIQRGRNEKGK